MALSPADVLALYRFPLLNRGSAAGGGSPGTNTIIKSYYLGEGNYSSWGLLTDLDLGAARSFAININAIWIDEKNSTIIFNDASNSNILSAVKVDGSELSDLISGSGLAPGAQEYYSQEQGSHTSSVYGRYGVVMNSTLTTLYVLIGGAIQTLSASSFSSSNYNRTSCFAISPSGKYVVVVGPKAAADHQCHMMVWRGVGTDVNDSRIEFYGKEGNYSTYTLTDYSPISAAGGLYAVFDQYLYFRTSGDNYVVDLETGTTTELDSDTLGFYNSPNESIFGKYIVTSTNSGFKIYKDGILLQTVTQNITGSYAFISPLGKYIAIYYSNQLYIYRGTGTDGSDNPSGEGDYNTWIRKEDVLINVGPDSVGVCFTGTKVCYVTDTTAIFYDIPTGETTTLSNTAPYVAGNLYNGKSSIMNTYLLDREGKKVLKYGVAMQTFVVPEGYLMLYSLTISQDGRYICAEIFDGENYFLTIFEGCP